MHHVDDRTKIEPSIKTPRLRARRPGLRVRFVTRMSDDLSKEVAAAARQDGVTAGAWVRRLIMDRVGIRSDLDARSGRPVRRPDEDVAAISAAIRDMATVSAALSIDDKPTAKSSLDRARAILIPLAIRRPSR